MRGKEKCKILKEIRQRIASENDIPFVTSECKHKGECKGTCPKCEAELRFLEQELEKKGKWKMLIPMTGLAAMSLASCGDDMVGDVAVEGADTSYCSVEAEKVLTAEQLSSVVESHSDAALADKEGDFMTGTEMADWIQGFAIYPCEMLIQKSEGHVIANFTVGRDWSIQNLVMENEGDPMFSSAVEDAINSVRKVYTLHNEATLSEAKEFRIFVDFLLKK